MNTADENPWMAFGLTFQVGYFDRLAAILGEENISAEGTSASGYELYVRRSDLNSLGLLRTDERIRDLEIQFYESPRNISDGSRYDRLVDHFKGPDPSRPPLTGISFGDDGVRGIVRES